METSTTVNDCIVTLKIDNEPLRNYLRRDPTIGAIPVEYMRNLSRAGYYQRAESVEKICLHEALTGDDLSGVFLHEVAHAICRHFYGPRVGHGRAWRLVMITLGCRADRCYDGAELNGDKPARYNFQCVDCGAVIKRHRWAAWMSPDRIVRMHHNGCRNKPGQGRLARITEISTTSR